ncbi:MAG TPA: MFS transporter [Anaerolineae bacterium]|nr:MFS transporter [Anaerolineae bacterium]
MAYPICGLFTEERLEKDGRSGLFRPSILQAPGLKAGFVVRFLQMGITAAFLYILPLLLQLSFNFTAMQTGVALMPFSLSLLIFALLGARLSARFFANRIIQAGFIIAVAGLGSLGISIQPGAGFADLVLGALFGAGVGLIVSQILNLILSAVAEKDTAETAGLTSTFEQLGNAIGVALVGTVMLASLATVMQQKINDSTVLPEEAKSAMMTAVEDGIQLMSNDRLTSGLEATGADPAMIAEVETLYGQSRTEAFRAGVALLVFAGLAGLVASLWLPKRKLVKA